MTRIFPETPECVTALRQVRSRKGLRPDLLHAQKCKEVWRQLNGSASLYRNTVVQALLNVEEDHGYYREEGQQPYRWEVGQEVYRARHGLDRNIGFRTQKWKRLVEG